MKYELTVDNVAVESDYNVSEKEARAYIQDVIDKTNCDPRDLEKIVLSLDGKEVDIDYQMEKKPFERIRRITGYLVGTVDRWNNAKQAELRDRVSHATCGCN